MAAKTDTGMEKDEMKKLLIKSKVEPVNCAFALGSDPSMALLMLHKVKAPKGVLKELTDKFPAAKSERWGSAEVDVDDDPKLVKFRVNKGGPGFAKKLMKTLKGTGFTKAIIMLEDGTVVENVSEEEEGAAGADGEVEAEEAPLDVAALTAEFRNLAGRIGQIDPGARAALLTLAAPIPGSLKSDLAAAAAQIAALRMAVDDAGLEAAPTATATDAAAFVKSRDIWVSTRTRVENEIERLRSSIAATYANEAVAGDIETSFHAKVEPVMKALDLELAQKLDAMTKPADPAERTRMVGEARGVLQRYAAYVSSEPLIADLDSNPFVPLSIRQTVTGSLAALAQIVK